MSEPGSSNPSQGWRWLAIFAVAYGLLHHQGFVLGRLGDVGETGTRLADWIDLATPYLVLLPAAVALRTVAATARQWAVLAVGAITYVEGHGIHLAANSINNTVSGDGSEANITVEVIHLWDEPVGHFIWFAGLSLVTLALALAFGPLPAWDAGSAAAVRAERLRGVAVLLSFIVGVTYVTNSLEGHFAVPGLIFTAAMSIWALRRRSQDGPGRGSDVAALTFGSAFLLLGFYGIWHRGFPEPTSVGWNILAL